MENKFCLLLVSGAALPTLFAKSRQEYLLPELVDRKFKAMLQKHDGFEKPTNTTKLGADPFPDPFPFPKQVRNGATLAAPTKHVVTCARFVIFL
jgi:hypothetical protein